MKKSCEHGLKYTQKGPPLSSGAGWKITCKVTEKNVKREKKVQSFSLG